MPRNQTQYALTLIRIAVCAAILGSNITLSLLSGQSSSIPLARISVLESQIADQKSEQALLRSRLEAIAGEQATMKGLGIGATTILGLLSTIQLLLMRKKDG